MLTYRKFAKDLGVTGVANFLLVLRGIVLLPVITKLLGAESYGIWVQLSVTLTLLAPFLTLGLPGTLVRFLAGERNKREIQDGIYSVLLVVFGTAGIGGILLILFSSSIGQFLHAPPLFIQILAFIIILEALNLVLLNIFRAFQQMQQFSFFLLFLAFGEIGFVSLALVAGYGLLGALLSFLLIRGILFAILLILLIKRIGIAIPTFSPLTQYLSFGLPTVLSGTSYWIITSSDRYLIGFLMGILWVGYYAPAYAIGNIINLFIFPFSMVLPGILSRLFNEQRIEEIQHYLTRSFTYLLLIMIPAAFGLSILSKQILTMLSTPEIASNASFIVPFIVLSVFLYGINTIGIQIIDLYKKTKISATIWMFAAVGNIILNLLLIPKYGILGAAIATLLVYIAAVASIWYVSFQSLRFPIRISPLWKSVLASLVMSAVLVLIQPSGVIAVIFAILLGTLIYVVSLFLLRTFTSEELMFFQRFLHAFTSRPRSK